MQRDQAKELLAVIRKRGTSAFDKFVEVLLESDTMSFLGKRLRKETWEDDKQYGKPAALTACANVPVCCVCLTSKVMLYMHTCTCTCITVEEVLKRAHVPPRHGVYVERKAMILKIREELYKLKDQDGYELHLVCCEYHNYMYTCTNN